MRNPRKQFIRPVLIALLLVLGPLNAHAVFACAMMGGVVLDNCCCDEHEPADMAVDDEHEPCCEKSIELRIDLESGERSHVTKPVEIRSDVDPPPAILFAADLVVNPYRVIALYQPQALNTAHLSGTHTYLHTQRLRI